MAPSLTVRRTRWRNSAAYNEALDRLQRPMLALSVAYLLVVVLRAAQLPPDELWRAVEVAVTVTFALELAVLRWTAPDKVQALKDHWLDALIVAAPFLRPLRLGRLLRVVRAGSAAARAIKSLRQITDRRGVRSTTAIAATSICLLGLLTWAFERNAVDSTITTAADGVWWALVTSTTVGYGDLYPTTGAGRLVGGAVMIIGVALLGTVTAAVAAFFVERDADDDDIDLRLQEIRDLLDPLITSHPPAGQDDLAEAAVAHLRDNALPVTPATTRAAALLLRTAQP